MPTLKEKKQQKEALKLASVGGDDDADFFRQQNFLGLPLKVIRFDSETFANFLLFVFSGFGHPKG